MLESSGKWQAKTEAIATSTAKRDNIYQSQLNGVLAFSEEQRDDINAYCYEDGYYDSNNVWHTNYDKDGNPIMIYPYDYKYCESGFVAHHLFNFYNMHLNDGGYKVLPVDNIAQQTGVPAFSGAGSTGWFLPGKLEWNLVKENKGIIDSSLSRKNAGSVLDDASTRAALWL